MKEWLRKVIEKIAIEVLKRDSEIVVAVNEAISEIYDNIEELGGGVPLTYQNTTQNEDGSFTMENDYEIVTTTFSRDAQNNRVITEVAKTKEGTVKSTKTTTISVNATTGKKEIKEVYS